MIDDLGDKRVVVMGLGRFGGGAATARYLVSQGAQVLVTDLAPPESLGPSLSQLADLPIEYRLGEHRAGDFTSADLIVVNPAVDPRNNNFLRAAAAIGVPTTSEIRLLVSRLPNRGHTIAVTGTAGKSTVTAMVGHILAKTIGTDRVHVGGNIGKSLLNQLNRIQHDHWVILELSSFMLESLAEDCWSPHIAVITNFSSNHLDRHVTLEAYQAAKQLILDFQQPDKDIAIFGPCIHNRFLSRVERMYYREQKDLDEGEHPLLLIPGRHNQMNALLAAVAVEKTDSLQWEQAAITLKDFAGLPHRLQFVREHDGIRYFNDSKSTTPQTAILAIECFGRGIIHVILGGYDKASDMQQLADCASQRCRAVYTIGATGESIAQACTATNAAADVVHCGTVDQAVKQTTNRVRHGDVVLLSPGCASWDQFDNYEHRGGTFIEAVNKYVAPV